MENLGVRESNAAYTSGLRRHLEAEINIPPLRPIETCILFTNGSK